MARHSFGGGVSDFPTVLAEGEEGTEETEGTPDEVVLAMGEEVLFFDQEGEPVTDLLDEDENPVTSITIDSTGRLPLFYGPDNVACLIAEIQGTQFVVGSRDVDQDLAGIVGGIREDIDQLSGVEERILNLETFSEEEQSAADRIGERLVMAESDLDRLVNEFPLMGQVVLFAESNSYQSVPGSQWTTINWTSASVNEVAWDPSEPGDITLAYPGLYEVSGTLWFSSGHGATIINAGVFEGSQVQAESRIPVGPQNLAVSAVMKRAILESDGSRVIQIRAWHNSSSSVTSPASTGNPTYYSTVCVKFKGALGVV